MIPEGIQTCYFWKAAVTAKVQSVPSLYSRVGDKLSHQNMNYVGILFNNLWLNRNNVDGTKNVCWKYRSQKHNIRTVISCSDINLIPECPRSIPFGDMQTAWLVPYLQSVLTNSGTPLLTRHRCHAASPAATSSVIYGIPLQGTTLGPFLSCTTGFAFIHDWRQTDRLTATTITAKVRNL
jgi:hypothetical protein